MSGGLDSSAVAALLVEAGCEVMGLTLHLFQEGSRCCSLEDIERARRVCDHLGIPHHTFHAVDLFEEAIIRPFADAYAQGLTPSPCVLCNQHVKFGALVRRAAQLGCGQVATGHYVRTERRPDGWHLFRGHDAKKDQSYFLHRLSQDQLAAARFPLEGWTKDRVAAYAEERGLPVSRSAKAESQDLCFLDARGHGPMVERYHPELSRPGEIVDEAGTVVGRHAGFFRYTIGQRKGLGVAAPERLYVKATDPAANRVVLAPRAHLHRQTCQVEGIHWILPRFAENLDRVQVRIRYRSPAVWARVRAASPEGLHLAFEESQFAVTPGQAAVFYDGDEVLGGGWIAPFDTESDA